MHIVGLGEGGWRVRNCQSLYYSRMNRVLALGCLQLDRERLGEVRRAQHERCRVGWMTAAVGRPCSRW